MLDGRRAVTLASPLSPVLGRKAFAKAHDPTPCGAHAVMPAAKPMPRCSSIAARSPRGSRLVWETRPPATTPRLTHCAVSDPAKDEDTARIFAQVVARLERIVCALPGLRPGQTDPSETRAVTLRLRTGALDFDGQRDLTKYALPIFDAVTGCAILCRNGMDAGKKNDPGRFFPPLSRPCADAT